jgi:4-amino-4-deoxy-L-arabinose transferase-like glycosyltransferase
MGKKKSKSGSIGKNKKQIVPEIKKDQVFIDQLLKGPSLYIFLGVILLLGIYLRFSHLSADPPPDLSWSQGPYTDEGAIAINARNKVLWGEWKMDDFFRMGISSLLSFSYFFIFKLAGIGFIQIRILPVLLSLGTILLVFFQLKREGSSKAAIFSFFFLAISYIYVMHNRLAMEETSLLFFLFLSLFFVQLGKHKKAYFILGGVVFALAVLFVKISGFFFFPVIIFEILRWAWIEKADKSLMAHGEGGKKKIIPSLFYFGSGIVAGVIIWLILVLLPYKDAVIGYMKAGTFKSLAGSAENLGAYLRNLLTLGISDKLFPRVFFIFCMSFLYILYWIKNIGAKIKTKASLEFVCVLWIIMGILFLSYPNYHPIRYQLILVPPMCILAGFFVEKIMDAQKIKLSGKLNPLSLVLQFGILVVFIYNLYYSIILYILFHYQSFYGTVSFFSSDPNSWFEGIFRLAQNYSALVTRSIILALLVTGGVIGFSQIQKLKQGFIFPKSLKYLLVGLMLFLIIFSDLKQYSVWSGNLTYDLLDISKDLSSLPKGSIIVGPWAATLSLETPHKAIMMQDFANKEKVIQRFKPTHLIISKDGWEDKYFKQTYPDLMSKAILLKEYPVHTSYNRPLLLYELSKK